MAEEGLDEQIQHRAYESWLSESCPVGRDRIHWLCAEAEIREKICSKKNARLTKSDESPHSDCIQETRLEP